MIFEIAINWFNLFQEPGRKLPSKPEESTATNFYLIQNLTIQVLFFLKPKFYKNYLVLTCNWLKVHKLFFFIYPTFYLLHLCKHDNFSLLKKLFTTRNLNWRFPLIYYISSPNIDLLEFLAKTSTIHTFLGHYFYFFHSFWMC